MPRGSNQCNHVPKWKQPHVFQTHVVLESVRGANAKSGRRGGYESFWHPLLSQAAQGGSNKGPICLTAHRAHRGESHAQETVAGGEGSRRGGEMVRFRVCLLVGTQTPMGRSFSEIHWGWVTMITLKNGPTWMSAGHRRPRHMFSVPSRGDKVVTCGLGLRG